MENIYEKGLVSIIVPCYNGATYLMRLLDSLCLQTYKKMQLIFVNDGSEDDTESVFYSYQERFNGIGLRFDYIMQKNGGQASAINAALHYVKGEYLMWLDADDFITDDHVKKKVDCLNSKKEYDIVRCKGVIVDEYDIRCIKGYLGNMPAFGSLFEDLLFEFRECSSGLYMVRTKHLLNVLPERQIYPSMAGQNFQLLLPITYFYKVFYIEDYIFYCVERRNSHSHRYKGIGEWKIRLDDIKDIKVHVLSEMKRMITQKYMSFIYKQLGILEIFQRINKIIEYDYDIKEKEYVRDIMLLFYRYMKKKSKGEEYWIWGACEKSERLAFCFESFLGISVEGYVDSNIEKQKEDQVISPEKIDASKMFIMVLLEYHQDIVDKLYSHGFKDNVNFIYPKYELIRNLKNFNK